MRAITIPILTFAVLAAAFGQNIDRAEADGIGVYPIEIEFEDALRGGEYFRAVVMENDSDFARVFTFATQAEAGDWVTFVDFEDRSTPVEELMIGPNEEAAVMARLIVPTDAPNGAYAGALQVLGSPAEAPSVAGVSGDGAAGGSGIAIGTHISLQVLVTGTENLAGSLTGISTRDTEVGVPLRIETTIHNSGNVRVVPLIDVRIVSADGGEVDALQTNDKPVYPSEQETIFTSWDTTSANPGEYTAQVSVRYGDSELGTQDLPFTLHPRGALTREGRLESLILVNEPVAGGTAQVTAEFTNTGIIESRAVFAGEFYRDDALISAVDSRERLVLGGASGSIDIFVEIPDSGTYTLRGRVNFEGKETEERELTFEVGGEDGMPMLYIAGPAAAAALVVLGVVVARLVTRNGRARPSAA